MTHITRLWHTAENGKRRLMAEIDSSSQFYGFKPPPNLYLKEQREKCAEMIKRGWIDQGEMKHGKWDIEHSDQRIGFRKREEAHVQ